MRSGGYRLSWPEAALGPWRTPSSACRSVIACARTTLVAIFRALSAIFVFFFNATATTEIYTLSLHDALPIWPGITDRYRVILPVPGEFLDAGDHLLGSQRG